MGTLFISLLTLVLLLISAFIVLIILMQRTSQSGGMGAALGGGAAESAFGADTTNVLTKGTIYGIIAFFVVALGLYLIYQSQHADRMSTIDASTLVVSEEISAAPTDAEDAITGAEAVVEDAIADAEAVVEDKVGTISEEAESIEVPAVEVPEAGSIPVSE